MTIKETKKIAKDVEKDKKKIEEILIKYGCELMSADEYHHVLVTKWDCKNNRHVCRGIDRKKL